MLLQRKYESREASSRSVKARGAPGRVSSSTRNRKWGETSTACTASWMPFSNRSPFFRARSTSADQAVDLGGGGGSAESPGGELLEDFAGDLAAVQVRRAAEDDPPVRVGQVVWQAVDRADDLEPIDGEVAVAFAGVGDVGIPGVVGERGGEPLDRELDLELRLEDGGRILFDLHLEGPGRLAVDQEFQLGQILARLLPERPGLEDVGAGLRERRGRPRPRRWWTSARSPIRRRRAAARSWRSASALNRRIGPLGSSSARIACSAIDSAAARYFSIRSGGSERTSPMLSKP